MDYEARYKEYQQAIEKYLDGLFTEKVAYGRLYEAMRYAILGGGKRIRPVLTLEFARLGGIDWHLALPFGCALELVHNYSLIHDDLPCMDDDDLRRGKPTCHKAYGETLAVLAGDALQPEAFRLILEAPMLPADTKLEALRVLVKACGADGMVGGQVLDTVYDVRDADTVYNVNTAEGLTQLNRLKTGVMISGAAELGCVAAKMNQGMRSQALAYADGIGKAFQIRDDILDVTSTMEELGKPVFSDEKNEKTTYVTLFGTDGAEQEVKRLTKEAVDELKNLSCPGDKIFLEELFESLTSRKK